jgi:hypothetical protein
MLVAALSPQPPESGPPTRRRRWSRWHRRRPSGGPPCTAARADLLRAAAIDGILTLDEALANAGLTEQPAAEALRALSAILVRSGDRLHFVLMAGELLGDAAVTEVERRVDARLHRVLDRAVAEGVLRADVPKAWRVRVLEALVYAAWTAVADGELAVNDAPGLVHDAMLRGLGTP